jgi:hypothetical protein
MAVRLYGFDPPDEGYVNPVNVMKTPQQLALDSARLPELGRTTLGNDTP